jgi:NAD(P)-dependent dehydrogenase (short-subunit alcohol dehydrogenase family)
MKLFAGKVAVITGAGSGLGREYALALAEQGASIVVNDFGATVQGEYSQSNPAEEVVNEINSRGGKAVANVASVADWAEAESIIDTAISSFGSLDIVINNAGNNRPSSLINLTEQDVDSQLDVHLKGTLAVSHFAAVHWNKVGPQQGRAIVNTTSAVGLHPTSGGGVYGAAKSAITALTVSHAQELARLGVRVNAVAPLVLYLSSDICRFTARIFAIEGPDVAIYQPFGVEQHWTTHDAWTVDALAQTFSQINERSSTRAFFPGGVVHHNTPSGRTLKNLSEFEN